MSGRTFLQQLSIGAKNSLHKKRHADVFYNYLLNMTTERVLGIMEEKIIVLESKISYLEKFLDELNEVVIEQQKQIDNHKNQIDQLKSMIKTSQDDNASAPANEKPPHY